ncbi:hypothetical protein FBEOM_12992 [Fusarium beomiforme]|uniref:DUF7702 domain-containing protein n=1 Tax=Fusarium beomiforme TaxID=44412 RepID=A0A9P5DSI3_9HYPO|nr:hypothetical protein FBEOM_12992 [Fusarium beomiforme]
MPAPSPPTTECIGLSATALIVFSILFFPALYIAYRHRTTGQNCWPILISFFIFRIASDIYYLSRLNEPDTPTTFAMVAAGACAATQSLTIIGLIYEALNLPLSPYKRSRNRIVLITMHVIYTIATVFAAYGGNRDTSMPGNVRNKALSQAGNVIMFLVMLGTLVWLYPAGKHTFNARQDLGYHAAKTLLMAAAPATVLQLIRMNYDLIYALTLLPQLHPTTGSFAMRFITFSLQLAIVTIALTAGWLTRDAARIRIAALQSNSSMTGLVEVPSR